MRTASVLLLIGGLGLLTGCLDTDPVDPTKPDDHPEASLAVGTQGPVVLFSSDGGGFRRIWRMTPPGGSQVSITSGPGGTCPGSCGDWMPDLSPNGSRIVFSRNWNLYSTLLDGSGLTQLTFEAPLVLPHVNARWSPDGQQIVWQRGMRCCTGDQHDLWVMNADGSNGRALTSDNTMDAKPDWSPSGELIVFTSNRSGTFELWSIWSDGSNPRQLTNAAGNEDAPRFSPDGRRIAYMTDREGRNEIFVMNADGTDQRQVTNTLTGESIDPSWSADGKWILFASNRSGQYDIYRVRPTGGSLRRLTTQSSSEVQPSWH